MEDPVNKSEEQKGPEPTKEEEILELAKKELMREIKCASMRAEQFGAHSWAKPQNYVPSKRFLKQMLMCTTRSNERKERERYSVKHRENRIIKKGSVEYSSQKSYLHDKSKKDKHSRESSPSRHKNRHREYKNTGKRHYKH